jgi:protein-disulfide isomerase
MALKQKNIWKPVSIFLAIIIVLMAALGLLNNTLSADIDDLPNYTQVKGSIVVDGFQYEKQPMLGNPDAPVKVIEFGDFKCPACKQWEETIFPQFKQDFIDTGKVSFYFMNYAFIDRDSYLAASAGEAIAKQSNEAFWEYYAKLYENQGDESRIWATRKFVKQFVRDNVAGIDYERFVQDLDNDTYMFDVKEDFKIGGFYGVNGTPQFMINGKLFRFNSYEEMSAAIEAAQQN